MTATKALGTYGNAVGVVTPLDHKMAQSGLLTKTSGNAIRPGLFWGGSATIITGKANMSYDVAAFTVALSRGATAGTVLLSNDGTLNVATTAAPGSNSRIDIIYVWAREYSLDGVDSNPVIGVAQGTAAASPTAPSLASYPGAIEIGRATVGAGITATTSATITQTAPFTAPAGGTVVVRNTTERDAGTWTNGQRIRLLDTGTEQVYTGSAWDAGWVSTAVTLANVTVGNGTVTNMMRRTGNVIELQGSLLFGSGTSIHATLPPGVTLPVAAASRYGTASTMHVVGDASSRSAAAAKYPGAAYIEASTTVVSLYNYIVLSAGGTVLPLQPMVSSYLSGAGTFISWNIIYEAA